MDTATKNPILAIAIVLLFWSVWQNDLTAQTVSFNQTQLNFNDFDKINSGTSLQFGPDERLYVSQLKGEIKIYTVLKAGANQYDVVGEEILLGVKGIPNHDDTGLLAYDNRNNRQITGLTVVGTSENPVIYVSSSDPKWGGPSGDKVLDTNSGVITRISWTGTTWEVVDLVRGLPRSEENHSTNGLEFTTLNGKPYLLVASGGLTNAGAPSKNFAYITEFALSAAILSIDLDAIEALPTQTDSNSGRSFKYDIPTLDDPSRENKNAIYDPNDPNYDGIDVNDPFGGNDGLNMGMVTENGPVQIFSPGYRNSYDLVVTEDRKLFVTDNGANINWGGLPLGEGDATQVSNNYDPGEPGASPLNPSVDGEFVDNQDHLLLVTTDLDTYVPGSYYGGHPTPIRANPGTSYPKGAAFPYTPGGAGLYTKFVGDNGGYANITPLFTPSDQFRTQILEPIAPGQPGFDAYAANSLPANWPPVPPNKANPAEADFIAPTLTNSNGPQPDIVTVFPNNSNGIAEYKASNFDGALKGSLIVGKNGGTLHLIHLNADGSLKEAEFGKWNLNGGNALGIATNGDSEIFPGTVWVATFDNRIMVLTPEDEIFCIAQNDPDFDPAADYDHDGYTNQDEIDNGTDYCSGASAPDDYDKDFVSNLNDLDDDGDGIADKFDPFQIGYPSDLPLENQLFTNQSDASGQEFGYLGLGLTGLMNNGVENPNWLNWLDKGNDSPGDPDIYGGTAGAIQLSMTGGTANGTVNNQDKGFQLGVNAGIETGNYTITSGIIGLSSPGQLYDYDGNGEIGIQIGDGTQSNFIKLVFTKAGILAAQEINDTEDANPLFLEIPASERPDANTLIELAFEVNPYAGTVEPKYKYNDEPYISLGIIESEGTVKAAIRQLDIPLAIGVYGSSHDPAESFIGVWNYIKVSGEVPYSIRTLRDISRLLGDPDVERNLDEYFADDDGLNNLTYSISKNTNPVIGAEIIDNILRVIIPNDEVSAEITVRATDSNGYFVEQTFAVKVEQEFEILLRINAGGPVITGNGDLPNWLSNSLAGPENSDLFSVSGGKTATNSFTASGRHASIPDYVSDDEYVKIFNKERYTQDANMEYKIPLPNGDYLVNLYMGNGFEGTSTLLKRYFDIEIEGQKVESSLDLIERFGHLIGGMEQYPVTITDGELNIVYLKQKENPLLNGIEIIGKPIQIPIVFEKVEDQIDFVQYELDGSMFVSASGGNGNLNYSADGLPPGIYLEPTNGTIYGTIEEGALANSPYRVTITIDDEDAIHSDAVSFNFTWTISPELSEQKWTLKEENTAYTGRHENSFVQAGNKFYLMGGRESAKTIDIYDYAKDEWSSLSNINPHSFNHFQALHYDGLIWVIGAFQTNDFPDEIPASHIWMFDPVREEWIQGPEIPENRRRGSAGLVEHRGKFYLIGGNTKGHNGGFVPYFDSYDPETGEWSVLEDAPRARDHFFATKIGSRMYVVSGRQSGGAGGTFAPVLPEVDVYDFNAQTWSTLPAGSNLPTPRAGAIVNNYLDKLIVAGGEIPGSSTALATTEMFDPLTASWQALDSMNFARHGTQGIVSGKGLFVLGGSPNRGGGNQKNMEYFGFDQPIGEPLANGKLIYDDSLLFRKGQPKELSVSLENGNTGLWIRSVELQGANAQDFIILAGELPSNVFWKPGHEFDLLLDYEGDALEGNAELVINWGRNGQTKIPLQGDGDFEEVSLYFNSGTFDDVVFNGKTYLGDFYLTDIHSGGSVYKNTNIQAAALYQTERFATELSYDIQVPNGVYTITTHHAETWFGQPGGGTAGAGKRVYDIYLENSKVKGNFDLFVENNNQPMALVFENIEVRDGKLDLDLVALTNNASISGLSIVNQSELGDFPVANINASASSGNSPLTVSFTNDIANPENFTFFWDFGDGSFSSEQNPTHVFESPGDYVVSVTVYNEEGESATDQISINVSAPGAFELHVNGGSNNLVNLNGTDFLGEGNSGVSYTGSSTFSNNSGAYSALYYTERFGSNFAYTIPVENGTYTVKTYHNELWFGRNGPESKAGQRVYDILVEGNVVREDFDLFVANGNQPIILTHENISVTDGVLEIRLIASANNGTITGFSIISEESTGTTLPQAVLESDVQSGTVPLLVNFTGSNSNGDGALTYTWDFGDGSSSSLADPSHEYTSAGQYTVKLTVSDENGNQSIDEMVINVADDTVIHPEFSLFVNSGTNNTVNYLNEDFQGESTSGVSFSSSSTFTNSSAAPNALFHTERFSTNFTYSVPVENGIYTVKTYHNELWFGKKGPAAAAGQRVYDILVEGELVKDDFDLFVESGNEPMELIFTDIEVNDGVLTINLIAGANNASISGFSIQSQSNGQVAPNAVILATPDDGVAPLEVAFDGSSSSGQSALDYFWDFGDGTSSQQISPVHLYADPGTYTASLTVTDSEGLSDVSQIEIVARDGSGPSWTLSLNTGSSLNTTYEQRNFLGDKAFPDYYNSGNTFISSDSSEPLIFRSERYAKSLTYNIPVENGTYRVVTYHTEPWYGKGGPAAGVGNRVFDIYLEGLLVKDNFDIFVESNNLPTELTFENIQVSDGTLKIDFIASANNANVSGIVVERISSKNDEIISSSRLAPEAEMGGPEYSLKFPDVTLYPNPANQEAIIKLEGDIALEWISIYTMTGQQVMVKDVRDTVQSEYVLPLQSLEQGVYLIRLNAKNGAQLQLRLIVKR
ncbi:Por secretion system C-terminal sorting domain-containing protein [Cyclobacterium lianum]|uniref:Por secretion system C-terminal sorting domain-containing protein n=1 Tax=Cyclobacterium lianum TaxID=388280 RepID=A0A1M7L883_9BACT|nr:malectin domain-containing carbohydrate-binding protein [Cyclobacterium lianum]SHM74008.1 Por secretion system C-terminal sorting domain-containing protein [Cyclobacterium lianum]